MPSYNSEFTIPESIDSVIYQKYSDWELIIVDDRSTDNTWQVIQKYADKYENIHAYQNKKI
ncbi:glycosyltransferase [Vibrio parahaemolyticus]|nr:glycosyltransferase family 2 protein [Vibrio parahaemolyticus]WMN75947.1 glycosyltransferase [Vibrio parahaemolyticus]